jgi:hypothetical protein
VKEPFQIVFLSFLKRLPEKVTVSVHKLKALFALMNVCPTKVGNGSDQAVPGLNVNSGSDTVRRWYCDIIWPKVDALK